VGLSSSAGIVAQHNMGTVCMFANYFMSGQCRRTVLTQLHCLPFLPAPACPCRAGGAGITLTAGTHIILCEPTLNPSFERQAIGRSHRMGQDKPLTVTRLRMKGGWACGFGRIAATAAATRAAAVNACPFSCLPARPACRRPRHPLQLPTVPICLTAAGTVEEQIVEFVKRQVEEEEEDPEEQPESTAMEANTSEAGRRARPQAGGRAGRRGGRHLQLLQTAAVLLESGCRASCLRLKLLMPKSSLCLPASCAACLFECSLQ
jgi:hypothetical protein